MYIACQSCSTDFLQYDILRKLIYNLSVKCRMERKINSVMYCLFPTFQQPKPSSGRYNAIRTTFQIILLHLKVVGVAVYRNEEGWGRNVVNEQYITELIHSWFKIHLKYIPTICDIFAYLHSLLLLRSSFH